MNEKQIQEYVEEYLQEKKLKLEIIEYTLRESPSGAYLGLTLSESGSEISLESTGVGIVDACYNALMSGFADRYPSLSSIELTDAYFRTNVRTGLETDISMKSRMVINLEFKNKSKNRMSFSSKTSSVSYSAVSTLVRAFEFYMNCEMLFKRLRFLVEEAQERNRSDIAQKYYYALSKVVEVTNYRCVL